MKHSYYLWLLILSIQIISCSPEKEAKKNLYDIKALFESQQVTMEKANPKVQRISVLNNIADTIIHNSLNWEEELSPLRSMDINNSKYRDEYQEESGSDSGLNYIQFVLEKPNGSFEGVLNLKVWFQEQPDNPLKMEIEHQASNLVYDNSTRYEIAFEGSGQNLRIKSMAVQGHQDLMLKKPIDYKVVTEVMN